MESQVFDSMFEQAGCSDFQVHAWDFIYKLAAMKDTPIYHDLKEKIRKRVMKLMKFHPASKKNINSFAMRFTEIYALVVEFIQDHREENVESILVQIEYGDSDSTLDYGEFVDRLQAQLTRLDEEAKLLNKGCGGGDAEPPVPEELFPGDIRWDIEWFKTMRQTSNLVAYGAKKVMSTAYQSCQVLDLPPMSERHPTRGLRVVRRQGRRGYLRAISNQEALNRSHYYLSQIEVPDASQCVNIHRTPVLYNYGGKPKTTKDSIDLFQNKGGRNSSSLLGVDCSGFVTTALASAGLRLRVGVPIRPSHIYQVSSWLLKKPKIKNFSCLKKQTLSDDNPLQPGDIISSNTHVIIVDEVDEDPFGIQSIRQSSGCHSKNIRDSRFQFRIIQSSSNNNAVGINRMDMSGAASRMRSIQRGLKRTASRLCYSRFGVQAHRDIQEISILRHDSDNPKCREKEIHLKHQECLKFCEPTYL